jgi:hypothetical protein
MRSPTHNKPMTARILGAAAAVIISLILAGAPATMAQGDPGTTDSDRYATVYQGADRATFDRYEGDFKVCDNEADGRAVYVYFSATAEDGNYYYDNTDGCTSYDQTQSNHAGVMYVCEERKFIWDKCEGVITYWNL